MTAYRCDYRVGDLIDGKYTIKGILGTGSFGNVYKVEDTTGYVWALKMLRLWEVSSELHDNLITRFKVEYQTSRIDSKYLIHSYGYGMVKGNPYIVMEYCERGDLGHADKSLRERLPSIVRDILLGLHDLHLAGKVHRDLKPENVMIKKDGHAALTDFGIVGDKKMGLTQKKWWNGRPQQVFGTYLYMSPEQADRKGGGVTYLPTTDLWSLGVMIYEIVTDGAYPFGQLKSYDELEQYQERARKGHWDRETLLNTKGGKEWEAVISKCLEPDYRHRYQKAAEMLGDIPRKSIKLSASVDSVNVTRLCITNGCNMGKEYVLKDLLKGYQRMIHIGREDDNEIVLYEDFTSYISRYHCTIECDNNMQWYIRDGQWNKVKQCWQASKNGTFLDQDVVGTVKKKLHVGSIITIGDLKMIAQGI